MAYAGSQNVVARSGGLLVGLSPTTTPSLADVNGWLDEVGALIDGMVNGANGFAIPVVSTDAVAALAGVNADGALVLALSAKFPGDSAGPATSGVKKDAQRRFDKAMSDLQTGDHPAVLILQAAATGVSAQQLAGSNATDNPGYIPDELNPTRVYNPNFDAPFYKGMRT